MLHDVVRRVVITGVGAVSPIGNTARQMWSNCLAGRSIVQPIPKQWLKYSQFNSQFWAPLSELEEVNSQFSRAQNLTLDQCTRIAITAAREALKDADIEIFEFRNGNSERFEKNSKDIGVYMGTGVGGISSLLRNHTFPVLCNIKAKLEQISIINNNKEIDKLINDLKQEIDPPHRINPFIVSMLMPNAVSSNLGLFFGLKGPNTTYTVACAAGTVAIGNAYKAIRNGEVTAALTGGAEFLYDDHGYIFKGFDVAGVLTRGKIGNRANRPFDENRTGFLFSQGAAAVLVLEDMERAKSRNAKIIAEIVGYGESFEAHNIMQMSENTDDTEELTKRVLTDANVSVNDIDYINSHGTGTINNDEVEAKLIEKLYRKSVKVNSTKSLTGHAIGASGGLEAIVTAFSLKYQTTHACKNLRSPIAKLQFVQQVENTSIRYAISQSFAFGGHNAMLLLKRYPS